MFIYKITNLLNNKIYIGQFTRLKKWDNYWGSGKYVKSAIKKHGKENFKKEVIEECLNQEQLNEREIYWINKLNSRVPFGYNISKGGEGGSFKRSIETRKKMSIAKLGKAGKKHSQETIALISKRMSGENHPMYGKIGQANPRYGKHHSLETKAKIGKKTSIANFGKHHSLETKTKISNAMKKHFLLCAA